jgi:hypothetical protein
MIDAQPGVAGKRIPEIFPEGVDPFAGWSPAARRSNLEANHRLDIACGLRKGRSAAFNNRVRT